MRREQRRADLGSAEVRPGEAVVAGRPGNWQIAYRCGRRSLGVGSCVRLTIPS